MLECVSHNFAASSSSLNSPDFDFMIVLFRFYGGYDIKFGICIPEHLF